MIRFHSLPLCALITLAAFILSALPCAATEQDTDKTATQSISANDSSAAKTQPSDQALKQSQADADPAQSFSVPDVNYKNCADSALLEKVIGRLKQAETKNDLSRDNLSLIKDFARQCKAVLNNR